jgi:hypothetical protein
MREVRGPAVRRRYGFLTLLQAGPVEAIGVRTYEQLNRVDLKQFAL